MNRVDVVIKYHRDGKVGVFTDRQDVVKDLQDSGDIFDIHVK